MWNFCRYKLEYPHQQYSKYGKALDRSIDGFFTIFDMLFNSNVQLDESDDELPICPYTISQLLEICKCKIDTEFLATHASFIVDNLHSVLNVDASTAFVQSLREFCNLEQQRKSEISGFILSLLFIFLVQILRPNFAIGFV